MKKSNTRGITMTEVLVTLVIIGLLIAIGIPSVLGFINHSNTVRHSNIARSIFVAVQSELSILKNSGRLTELSVFRREGNDVILQGGYLSGAQTTSGLLVLQLPEEVASINQGAMYYMTLSKEGEDDTFLAELLEKTDLGREVLEGSISVELNAATGAVTAAFYSEAMDHFAYNSTEQENDLLVNRSPSPRRGVYLAAAVGLQSVSVSDEPPSILLTDGGAIGNALYCQAFVTDLTAQHTITITDRTGIPITDSSGRPYALTFTQNSITESDLSGAVARPYTDREGHLHAGSVKNGAWTSAHTVYTSNEFFDPTGGTVLTHRKVIWVLDLLDSNHAGITFENSIHVKYPDIGVRDITAVLNLTGSSTEFVSNIAHSYYARATTSTYFLYDARHFSNMRYIGTNPDHAVRNFVLLADVDFTPVVQFAPLNWVPGSGGIVHGEFVGIYSGIKNESSGFALRGINIATNQSAADRALDTGLFGTVRNSTLTGVCLEGADIATRQGGNIGAIAGTLINSRISLAAVNANVSVLEADDTDYATVNAGGLVGRMENSTIEHSYSSGSFSTKGHGALTVRGQYSEEINIGGIAGLVSSGRISTSYNNARINIASAVQNTTSYHIERPVYAALIYDAFQDISIGGIAGQNRGLVQNCYSTNFVGDYYNALEEANCGTIIGNNIGQSVNCIGLYNGVPYEMLGTNISGKIVTPEELKAAYEELGAAYQAGNLTSLPGETYHLTANYPYPVLSSNMHRFTWENIHSPIGFDLIGDVYFIGDTVSDEEAARVEAAPDRLHSNYIKVDLVDPSAPNYIDKLRIDVKYRGFSPLYARVQLEIFTVNRDTGQYIRPKPEDLEYTAYQGPSPRNELAWISNYGNDECFYYTVALRPNDNVQYTTLPFSTGAVAEYAAGADSDHVYLKVIASGVEPVKVSDFWSISKLPWR